MEQLIAELTEFTFLSSAVRILLAAIFGGLIGLERGRNGHDAGMRTHIFIALGSAMTALVGLFAVDRLGSDLDPLRIAAQVVSGIGFLGAGTILVKNRSRVTGLTTAAGMWATATVGLAVGFGFYEGAVLCTIICIITAAALTSFESNRKDVMQVYMEVSGAENVNSAIDAVREMYLVTSVITVSPKSNTPGNVGLLVTISLENALKQDVIGKTLALPNIIMSVEE